MNKKLFGSMVVAAAMLTGYSAYDAQNKKELSDAVLANVEALAKDESGGSSNNWDCWSYYKCSIQARKGILIFRSLE